MTVFTITPATLTSTLTLSDEITGQDLLDGLSFSVANEN
jgi:hypothetical protein